MKTFAIVLTVCIVGSYAATLKDDQKSKLGEYKESCITETGADKAMIDSIIKGGPISHDEKLDCFSACMLKKIGIMRPDGSIDVEAARTKAATTNVDIAKANKVIDTCKDLTGKDTCETGGKVFGCFITNKDFPVLD